jgi:hypothetical protein
MNHNPIQAEVFLPLPPISEMISAEQIALWRAGMEWTLAANWFAMPVSVPLPPPEPIKTDDLAEWHL